MALPDFVLVRAFDGTKLNLISSLTGLSYGSAVDAAPTITASIFDPHGDVLNAHRGVGKQIRGTKPGEYFFDRNADGKLDAIDVQLSGGPHEGKWYRLTQINATDTGLELEFQARSVARMRRKHGHVVAKRGRVTRAEFVRALIKKFDKDMSFFSRELHDTQPKDKGDAKNKGKNSKQPGIKKDAILKVKKVRATQQQLDVAEDILTECSEQKCSEHLMVAAIMTAIQESVLGKNQKQTGNDDVGVFQQGRNWISLKNVKDARKATRAFLLGDEADVGGTGKVKGWKQVHGNLNTVPGGYESAIKKVQISVGGYSQWQDEAEAIVEAMGTGGDGTSFTINKDYQFEVQKGEDFWTAIQRLADEVNWRAFVHDGVFYFMDDFQLIQGRPQYTLAKSSDDIVSLTFQLDDTQKFPNETSVTALTENWTAYPGDVVDLIEAGPATGRWLVKEIGGDYFSPEISVTLYQPVKPKKEPANETETVTAGGLDDGGGNVVKGAIAGSPVPGLRPHSATHETAGLPGYPAYDYMASAGTPCVAPVSGKIERLSGKDPSAGGTPGGPLGYSIYLTGSNGKSYYMTHLDKVKVKAGQSVRQGEQIAEVASGPRSWSTPHVHMGIRG
jgi:murein DD-endopeptidase MepM/ murein hydrolase activator NlpD